MRPVPRGTGWWRTWAAIAPCSPHGWTALCRCWTARSPSPRVPYGFVHRSGSADPPGVLRLGDQMGVIPSFSGDGMAIALHTAFAATASTDAATFHGRMRADLGGQIGRAMVLHRLGQALPGVLASAAHAWPGALALVARLTRVPERRLAWQ